MAALKTRTDFPASEEGVEVARILKLMTMDKAYNTDATYSANSDLYPNNLIPFIDKHMNYLRTHPATNPWHYLSNLRLMTRVK